MHRPQHPGNIWLIEQHDALLGAQSRIAITMHHTATLLAAATAVIERTRTILAERPAVPPTPPQPGDRPRD